VARWDYGRFDSSTACAGDRRRRVRGEAVSVILQKGWFSTKFRYGAGERIFLMAPLHHHFERKGWYESQVVMRFYILCVLCGVVALSTLKLR
jgi:phospho-N-acetylmuramoyl-pentapeptide-transferase